MKYLIAVFLLASSESAKVFFDAIMQHLVRNR